MKKVYALGVLALLFLGVWAFSAQHELERIEADGEVMEVDPLHSVILIEYKGVDTQFDVVSKDLLKDLSKRDLVHFTFAQDKNRQVIEKIVKTGEAPPKEEKLEIGKAVQDVIVGAGETAKFVTSPVPPVQEAIGGAVGATTDTTGAVLEDVSAPEAKTKF
jgi:hypothetical protein